jgi:membrane protein implicated in regulation of membrane protease activity
MIGLIAALGAWSWIILGVVLLAVEIVAPGSFILWLGIAALVTGVLAFVFDLAWQTQLIAYSLLAVLAVAGWWFYFGGRRPRGPEPVLHRRSEMYVGRVYTLDQPIVGGSGRIHIEDTVWRVTGPDLPAGAKVRVAAADGALLQVEEA